MTMIDGAVQTHFRDQLRGARAAALADSENFDQVLFALERLGSYLTPNPTNQPLALAKFEPALCKLAEWSPLAFSIPAEKSEFHAPFDSVLEWVRDARNDALHQGAIARNLTRNAILVALTLEDALNSNMRTAADFMIPSPICADEWQPISFVRQQMLLHSFSYLPFFAADGHWRIVSDAEVAKFLISSSSKTIRRKRLTTPLGDAYKITNGVATSKACVVAPATHKNDLVSLIRTEPLLVCDPTSHSRILGILTAFDLM